MIIDEAARLHASTPIFFGHPFLLTRIFPTLTQNFVKRDVSIPITINSKVGDASCRKILALPKNLGVRMNLLEVEIYIHQIYFKLGEKRSIKRSHVSRTKGGAS